MANQERYKLMSGKRARIEALARKTEMLTESWQREQGVRLLGQLAVNAEIKQRWSEPPHLTPPQTHVATGSAALSSPFQQRGSPLQALLAAGQTPVHNALAYIVSVLGLQRLASHQADSSHS